ncbi:LysE family translocator [Riemerella columbipharyngis]|uniref:Threonine/homoserine/homoserine lactone efflux protein n=1 Tax=Riemerella columbipharyngis TaxID=1071918 RepID=A0A1G7DG02_9FLAO|nr:LysE family transporter [Riemerella columbipharyngis]SDE50379.1 Threonine/homoserine/homoserine lactone efflux protein [Riemerella columbipharyngis]
MFELIISAVGLGLMLSLVFIGPIFFLLIETSFSRGPKHAFSLDMGVISADIMCILVAYFASDDLVEIIDKHPGFYRITAFIIFIYGIYMIVSKTKMHIEGETKIINQNYFKTFINGFLLNILNIGVVLFWLVTVISVRNQYPNPLKFMLYVGIMIATYVGIDIIKIALAKRLHYKLTQNVANRIRDIVGGILIVFSVFIFLQSFKKFNRFDRELERSGYMKDSTKHKNEIPHQSKEINERR